MPAGDVFGTCRQEFHDIRDPPFDGDSKYIGFRMHRSLDALIVSLHEPDNLYVEPNVEGELSLLDVVEVSRRQGLVGNTINYGQCMTRCMDLALHDLLGCALPWTRYDSQLPTCDWKAFVRFLQMLNALGLNPGDIYG